MSCVAEIHGLRAVSDRSAVVLSMDLPGCQPDVSTQHVVGSNRRFGCRARVVRFDGQASIGLETDAPEGSKVSGDDPAEQISQWCLHRNPK